VRFSELRRLRGHSSFSLLRRGKRGGGDLSSSFACDEEPGWETAAKKMPAEEEEKGGELLCSPSPAEQRPEGRIDCKGLGSERKKEKRRKINCPVLTKKKKREKFLREGENLY